MGTTHTKALPTRHARDKTGVRHGKCEFALKLLRHFGSWRRCVHVGAQ